MRISRHLAILVWIGIGLLTACGGTFAYETSETSAYRSVTGQVVKVDDDVFGGKGGDQKEFTIRYRMQEETHHLVTQRGIIDQMTRFGNSDMQPGDEVPLAVDPAAPREATLDSFNGRYPFTLMISVFTALFLGAVTFNVVRGAIPIRPK